jgi:hypothetical protein
MILMAPISVGELIDKITILQIKQEQITDVDKLSNVQNELTVLMDIMCELDIPDISKLTSQLKTVNQELWHIEDGKRRCEKLQQFNDEFVALARNVYLKNDLRASIKRQINILTNSDIIEEKSY